MQYDLDLQLKYYMIGPSFLTVAQMAYNFWASLALNKNSYQYITLDIIIIIIELWVTQ